MSIHTTYVYLPNCIFNNRTNRCIDAILDGSLNGAQFVKDPVFGFDVPTSLGSVPATILNPREAWADKV